jgi:Hemerythrin HHE cation binding domain
MPDPYRAAHKAIRLALGRLTESAGRTDFGDVASVDRFRVELEAVVEMLTTHARIEVQFLDPLLGTHDHVCAAGIQRDHRTLERKLHEVSGGIHAIDEILGVQGDGDVRVARARGHACYLQLTRFIADYLQHLADEEEQALPTLSQHVDGATMADALARARESVDPGEAARMTALMLSAMSHPERVAFLRASGSEALRMLARAVLGDVEWKAVERELG